MCLAKPRRNRSNASECRQRATRKCGLGRDGHSILKLCVLCYRTQRNAQSTLPRARPRPPTPPRKVSRGQKRRLHTRASWPSGVRVDGRFQATQVGRTARNRTSRCVSRSCLSGARPASHVSCHDSVRVNLVRKPKTTFRFSLHSGNLASDH